MSFITGFITGVVASWALSIGALIAFVLRDRRNARPSSSHEEHAGDYSCPEYPSVPFTHITGIGEYVRGSDD